MRYSYAHNCASGFSGSPAQIRIRRLLSLCRAGYSGPKRMNIRSAVGAVNIVVTPYRSTIDHTTPRSG